VEGEEIKRMKSYITLSLIILVLLGKPSEAAEDKGLEVFGDKLLNAIEIFTALSNYPVRYLSDPNISYKEIYQKKIIMDSVQYSRETLKFMKGDCDDLSVLYSSCLESIGIRTAFVVVPEHIFIIFNTGIHQRNGDVISYNKASYIVRDNYIWLPVETTKLGSSFQSAWLKGIEEYRRGTESGKLEIIDVQKGWERYPPVTLPPEDIPLKVSDKDQILVKLEKEILEINNYREDTFNSLVSKYKEEIEKRPNNVQIRNRLGIVYGKRGYDLAVKEFEEILRIDKYNPSVLNNIGNIYALKGKVKEANEYYRKAKELDPDDGGINFNLGLASFLIGDEEGALRMLQEALESFPTMEEASNILGFELMEEDVYLKGRTGKISKEEVKQLLEEALKKLPSEKEKKEEVKRALTFFGGTRGIDLSQATELSWLLYWKE